MIFQFTDCAWPYPLARATRPVGSLPTAPAITRKIGRDYFKRPKALSIIHGGISSARRECVPVEGNDVIRTARYGVSLSSINSRLGVKTKSGLFVSPHALQGAGENVCNQFHKFFAPRSIQLSERFHVFSFSQKVCS